MPSNQGEFAMKLPLLMLAPAALAACSSQAEQNVANQFGQTSNAIENTAASLEAEADNATRAASAALESQANEVANRAEAVERAATTPSDSNSAK
jgi:uncharacterized protein YcfL